MRKFMITGLYVLLAGRIMAIHLPPDSSKKSILTNKVLNFSGQFFGGSIYQRNRRFEEGNLSWIGSGQVNIEICNKLQIPINFTYREGQSGFSIPIRQFGLTPRIKSWTFHVGQNNIDLSQESFALQNRTIHGVGGQFDGNNIGFKVFKGRLTFPNLDQDSFSIKQLIHPQIGAKFLSGRLRIGKEMGSHLFANMLFAQDDTSNINLEKLEGSPPSANIIPEVGFRIKIKKFSLQGQLSPSLFTRNTGLNGIPLDSVPLVNRIDSLFPVNISTRLNIAAKGRMELNLGKFRLRARSIWVDPNYESMGLFYIQDDRFTYTVSASYSTGNHHKRNSKGDLPSRIWSLGLSGEKGYQTNNIKNTRAFTTERDIHAASLFLLLKGEKEGSPEFSLNANYRNFVLDLNPGLTFLSDSLKLTQLTQGGQVSMNWNWVSGSTRQAIQFQYIDQQLKDLSKVNSLFGIRGFNLRYGPEVGKWSPELSLQLNKENQQTESRDRIGVSLNNNLEFLEGKLSLQSNFQYVKYKDTSSWQEGSVILRVNLNLRISKHSSLSFNHQSHLNSGLSGLNNESRSNLFLRFNF